MVTVVEHAAVTAAQMVELSASHAREVLLQSMQARARPLVVQEAEHSVALVPVGTCRWPTEGHHLDLIGLAIIRPLAQGSRLQIQELGGLGNGAAARLRPMAKIH